MQHVNESAVEMMLSVAAYHIDGERWTEALRALEQLVLVRPTRANFWHLKGVALRRLNRPVDALEAGKKAFELDQNTDEIAVSLAELYMLNYKFVEAVALLNPVFNRGYLPDLPPAKQKPDVRRAGFSLAVIQKLGEAQQNQA